MTRLLSPYPHQVVANWIAANDANTHALSVIKTPRNITQIDGPNPFDYEVSGRRGRKIQAEAVGHTIGTAIGRIVSNTIGSLRDHLRTRR